MLQMVRMSNPIILRIDKLLLQFQKNLETVDTYADKNP